MLLPSPASSPARLADRHARDAAATLGLTLPTDVVLYLLLPLYADRFGLTLPEVGLLLAANRLVRIAGYGWISRLHARHGPRRMCSAAALATLACALGAGLLSGFWALLPLRLLWGLSYAAMNLSLQALVTAQAEGAAQRSGRAQAIVAAGPMLALPLAAVLAAAWSPRAVFGVLAVCTLLALPFARRLPPGPAAEPGAVPSTPTSRMRLRRPGSLDMWSFVEGLALDGLFIIGLTVLGQQALPEGAVFAAGLLMAARYLSEMLLSPTGGHLAERWGAERMLVALSLLTAAALTAFGAGGGSLSMWACAAAVVVLRALQLPLLAPIVAQRNPGPGRVPALAARLAWRDIGAGLGPMLAGLLLPVAPPWLLYGTAAVALGAAAVACRRPKAPEES